MKKYISFIIFGFAVVALISCSRNFNPDEEESKTIAFSATFDNDTKVAIDATGKTTWEIGDQIAVWDGISLDGSGFKYFATSLALTAEDITDEGKAANFTVPGLDEHATHYYAVYPVEAAVGSWGTSDGRVGINLTKDGGMTKALAHKAIAACTAGSMNFAFKNINQIIRFSTAITGAEYAIFKPTTSTTVAGWASYNPETAIREKTMINEMSTQLAVISAGECWFSILSDVELKGGFTINVCNSSLETLRTFTYSSNFTTQRNNIATITDFDSRTSAP